MACGPSRDTAQLALDELAARSAQVAADAQRFAASEYAAIDAELTTLKSRLAAGEYRDVVDAAPALTAKLEAVAKQAAERRAVLEADVARRKAEWTKVSAELEGLGQALEARLTMLARLPRLPDNMDRNTFATIGSDYAKSRAEFARATGAADAGNYAEALVLAKIARQGFESVLRDVGLAPALSSTSD